MVVVDRKIIDGKKVAFLDSDYGAWIDDCFKKAIEIASTGKYDECRFSINGVNLKINQSTTFEQLRGSYNCELQNI